MRRIGDLLATEDGRLEVRNDEILVRGDLAVVRGTFEVTRTPKAGGRSKERHRRFLEVWRREAGGWMVCRTMDNVGQDTATG